MNNYTVHMISFKRHGENAYNTLTAGQRVEPWQWQELKRFLDATAVQPVPVDDGSDLV